MAVIVTFTGPGPQGQPLRERRSIEGSTLRVGRSTDCELVLPDARIALLRARIDIAGTGATITAEGDPIEVNGRAQRSAALQPGDRLTIGPYSIEVEAARPGMPLALTVQWHPDGDGARAPRQWFRRGPPVSKRRLSYLAVAAIVLLFIVLPMAGRNGYEMQAPRHGSEVASYLVSAVGAAFVQSWNPGPVSRAHEAFGDDCGQCHGFPLVQVRDASCIACHKTITQHVRTADLNGPMAADMRERRCAQCHLDHKGRQMVPRAQEECTSCHRDIGRYTADAGAQDITDFAADHPRFRLALLDASRPEEIHRVRQGTPMTEHSNLKFNHALHLDPHGVRDPDGKRDARGMRNERGGRTVLQCNDCHQPAENGAGLQPISMDRHCRRCHSLAFEPQAMQRQVPHGSKEMETMLSEFYARLALRDAPPRAGDTTEIARTRPGATLTYEDRQRVIQIADAKTRRALRELFDTRGVCSTCHYVTRETGEAGWKIAPVRFTKTWMPNSVFSHASHKIESCNSCHDVTHSKDAEDIAMPDIATCRRCHVGSKPVRNKIASDCATCHKFHASNDAWDPSLQPRLAHGAAQ